MLRPVFDTLHLIYGPQHARRSTDVTAWSQIDFDRPVQPTIHGGKTSVAEKEQSILWNLMNSNLQSAMVVKYPSRLSGRSTGQLQQAMDTWSFTIRTDLPADWKLIYLLEDNGYRNADFIPCDAYLVSKKGAEQIVLQYQGMPDINKPFQIYQLKPSIPNDVNKQVTPRRGL